MTQFNQTMRNRSSHIMAGVLMAAVAWLLPATASAQSCGARMVVASSSPGLGVIVTNMTSPNLSVTFNYKIIAATVRANSNVYMFNVTTGAPVPITTVVSDKTIYIQPISPLLSSYTYRFVVMSGIGGISKGACAIIHPVQPFLDSYGNTFKALVPVIPPPPDIPVIPPACNGITNFVPDGMAFEQGCKYEINYSNFINNDTGGRSLEVRLGQFTYSRTGVDDNDFGFTIKMTDVHYDAATAQWLASISVFTNDGGGAPPTLLRQYEYLYPVANVTGGFWFSSAVYEYVEVGYDPRGLINPNYHAPGFGTATAYK